VQNNSKFWLFYQVLRIVRIWMSQYLICQDDTFPQLLWYTELRHSAADKIAQRLKTKDGVSVLKPHRIR